MTKNQSQELELRAGLQILHNAMAYCYDVPVPDDTPYREDADVQAGDFIMKQIELLEADLEELTGE